MGSLLAGGDLTNLTTSSYYVLFFHTGVGREIAAVLEQRIMVIDGAMGTMIQSYKLQEEDFRGDCLKFRYYLSAYSQQHQCVAFLLGLPTQFLSLFNQGESLQIFYMMMLAVVVLIPQPSHAREEGSGEDVQNVVCSMTMILALFPVGGASGKLHVPEYTKVQKLYSNFT